jgi:iron uptake system EfeUOB component EfeO/EfeM
MSYKYRHEQRETMSPRRRRRRRSVLTPWRGAALGVVAVALAISGYLAIGGRSGGDDPATVVVSATKCAPGWAAPRSGLTVFTVKNTSSNTIFEIDLVGANQALVYGDIDMLAPGTNDQMDAVLPPGDYSFQCESFAGATLTSRVERVTGPPVTGAHPFVQVTSDQIQLATLAYRNTLTAWMGRLAVATDALKAAVDGDDLARARQLWLPAHLDYSRLGAAYDTFGNFNDEINGRPLGLVGGVNSPNFQGFLRLEYGLWHGQPDSKLVLVVAALDNAVHGLIKQFPQMLMPANDLSLRAHEILENTLQFELTGETDQGSNTNLATAWANVQGTQLALAAIAPLLQQGEPGLVASLRQGLQNMAGTFKGFEHPDGTWTPLQSLTRAQREDLDGELGGLLEQLSVVPDLLELPILPATGDQS